MIRSVHIENYKCFREFDIELASFTVIIGPNDSGKTAFLECLRLADLFRGSGVRDVEETAQITGSSVIQTIAWQQQPDLVINIRIQGTDQQESVQIYSQGNRWRCHCADGAFARAIGSVDCYQLDAAVMKRPSLVSKGAVRLGGSGEYFSTFLEEMLLRDRHAFQEMEQAFCRRFPAYSGLILERTSVDGGAGLALLVRRGKKQTLPITLISDGAVLSLGYLAICYQPDPPKLVLIEEPENGVHHAKLKETAEILRELPPKGVQVVLTTHSPFLLDLVDPEEIRVFAKDPEGAVHVKKLSDYPEVERLKKHFMSGEIWTGLSEQEIVLGGGKSSD